MGKFNAKHFRHSDEYRCARNLSSQVRQRSILLPDYRMIFSQLQQAVWHGGVIAAAALSLASMPLRSKRLLKRKRVFSEMAGMCLWPSLWQLP